MITFTKMLMIVLVVLAVVLVIKIGKYLDIVNRKSNFKGWGIIKKIDVATEIKDMKDASIQLKIFFRKLLILKAISKIFWCFVVYLEQFIIIWIH